LQGVARLLVEMVLIERTCREMMSEFVVLLFFAFWCFMPKGEKTRGVNKLFDAMCSLLHFMSYLLRVSC
jgi:hypothetical protein